MENQEMNQTTMDINDMSAKPEDIDTKLSVDLLCGATVAFDVDAMDWGDLYNRIPEMDENIFTLKTMIMDLIRMEPGDLRDGAAMSIFGNADDFLKSVDITDLSYDIRPDITMYEKAMLICMDCVLILETIINYSQIYALSKVDTETMVDEMMKNVLSDEELTYMMNDITSFTEANPINFDESEEGDAT